MVGGTFTLPPRAKFLNVRKRRGYKVSSTVLDDSRSVMTFSYRNIRLSKYAFKGGFSTHLHHVICSHSPVAQSGDRTY